MTRTFTFRISFTATANFLLKGILLSLFCIMLPGCINTMNGSENALALQSIQKSANSMHTSNQPINQDAPHENTTPERKSKSSSIKNPEVNRFPEKSATPITPEQAPEHEEQYHDIEEEEKVMCVKFPVVVRLALMVLFVVAFVVQVVPM